MSKNIILRDKNDPFEMPNIPRVLLFHFYWLTFKGKYFLRGPFSRLKHIYKFIDR